MSIEWVTATSSMILALLLTIYTLYTSVMRRKKDIVNEGLEKGLLNSKIDYIKDSLDVLIAQDKITQKQNACFETRLVVSENALKKLEAVPERLTKLEIIVKKVYQEIR